MKVIKAIYDPTDNRRIEIYQRANGTFGFDEWKFSSEEKAWILLKKQTETIVDSLDRAIEEIRGRVEWTKQIQIP